METFICVIIFIFVICCIPLTYDLIMQTIKQNKSKSEPDPNPYFKEDVKVENKSKITIHPSYKNCIQVAHDDGRIENIKLDAIEGVSFSGFTLNRDNYPNPPTTYSVYLTMKSGNNVLVDYGEYRYKASADCSLVERLIYS